MEIIGSWPLVDTPGISYKRAGSSSSQAKKAFIRPLSFPEQLSLFAGHSLPAPGFLLALPERQDPPPQESEAQSPELPASEIPFCVQGQSHEMMDAEREQFQKEPLWEFCFVFSSSISQDSDLSPWIKVEPELKELCLSAEGEVLFVSGRLSGGGVEVTLHSDFADQQGRTLGSAQSFAFSLERPVQLFFPHAEMKFVNALREPRFSFYTVGVKMFFIRFHKVTSEMWPKFCSKDLSEDFTDDGMTGLIEIEKEQELEKVEFELKDLLGGRCGHLVAQIRPLHPYEELLVWEGFEASFHEISELWKRQPWSFMERDRFAWTKTVWLQSTDLCLSRLWDPLSSAMHAWDGERRQVLDYDLEEVRARAFLPSPAPPPQQLGLSVYAFTDRRVYAPGDLLALKAWAWVKPKPGGLHTPMKEIELEIRDFQGATLFQETKALSHSGSLAMTWQLPPEAAVGPCQILLSEPQNDDSKVLVDFLIGDTSEPRAVLSLSAIGGMWDREYSWTIAAGSPDEETLLDYRVEVTEEPLELGAWGDYQFAVSQEPVETQLALNAGTLRFCGLGQTRLPLDLREHEGKSCRLSFRATLRSEAGALLAQVTENLLLRPSELYLGLRVERSVLKPRESLEAFFIVVDEEGRLRDGELVEIRVADGESHHLVSTLEPQKVVLSVPSAGRNLLEGQVRDHNGRAHFSKLPFYKMGESIPEAVEILLDQTQCRVGQTATLWFSSPWSGVAYLRIGQGACSIRRVLAVKPGYQDFSFVVTEAMLGGGVAQLDLLGVDSQSDTRVEKRSCTFRVDSPELHFLVEHTYQAHSTPQGEELDITVTVRLPDGRPVSGEEMSLFLVENQAAGRGAYRIPKPWPGVFPAHEDHIASTHLWQDDHRSEESLFEGEWLRHQASHPSLGYRWPVDEPYYSLTPQQQSLQFFEPALLTDKLGQVKARVTLPKALKDYRLTTVAVAKNRRSAYQESMIRVGSLRWQVLVPAFTAPNSILKVEILLHNISSQAIPVMLAARGLALEICGEAGYLLKLLEGEKRAISFELRTAQVQEVWLQLSLKTESFRDSFERVIPIQT